jgi:glutaredoxin-like protein
MPHLSNEDVEVLKEEFSKLPKTVNLIYFTQKMACDYCQDTQKILEEIAGVSDKLKLQVYNFTLDKEQSQKYGIEKIPATVVMDDKDYGIRFYGIPSGYEFTSLIEAILMIGKGKSGLTEKTKGELKELKAPLHFQVFVTPT